MVYTRLTTQDQQICATKSPPTLEKAHAAAQILIDLDMSQRKQLRKELRKDRDKARNKKRKKKSKRKKREGVYPPTRHQVEITLVLLPPLILQLII